MKTVAMHGDLGPFRKRLSLLLFTLMVSAPAFGYETFPEFESLTESEGARFEGPNDLGSEYESDYLTYQQPLNWWSLIFERPITFDTTVGSTGPKNFLIQDRLRICKPLDSKGEFRLTQFSERDPERDSQHQILELIFRAENNWALSLYGQPSLNKRENDLGLGVIFSRNPTEEHRLFLTWVDFTRADRNDRSDFFQPGSEPLVLGLVGRRRWSSEGNRFNFWQYAIRHETSTMWMFPTTQHTYRFMQTMGSLQYYQTFSSEWDGSFQFQWDKKLEAIEPWVGSSQAADSWDRGRARGTLKLYRIQSYFEKYNRSWAGTMAGLHVGSRQWSTLSGQAKYLDVLPHGSLRRVIYEGEEGIGFLEAGYNLQIHHEGFDGRFLSIAPRDGVLEHRLNLTGSFEFVTDATLELLVSFDLDYLKVHAWEGGNARFRMAF